MVYTNCEEEGETIEKVDKRSQIPLHVQLSEIIRDLIHSQQLNEGDALMSERELCKQQDVSRMTVNKAILKLVDEGLLERKQGKGTFVSFAKKKHTYQKLEGLTDMMLQKGRHLSNQILVFERSLQTEKIRSILKIEDETTEIYKIQRLRLIDQMPFILETVYINEAMCNDLNEELVRHQSLYELYRDKYQYEIIRAEQTIAPIMIDKQQAKLLNRNVHALGLEINRVVFTSDEEIMEYSHSIFLTDQHEFEIILHQN